jgi:dienelactone hydrolase
LSIQFFHPLQAPQLAVYERLLSFDYNMRMLHTRFWTEMTRSGMKQFVQWMMRFIFVLSATLSQAQERVEIPNGDNKPLQGLLFKPSGEGPFPSVIALHGCGGLGPKPGVLNGRHADWGQRLAKEGYIVLFPDSFGSRGLESQCLVKDRTVRPNRERVTDAQISLEWLQNRSDVIKNRVSLLGWSHGGSSLLWTIAADRKMRGNQPDFYRAVAFYPGCRQVAEAAQRRTWTNRVPLLILIGEEDTWTPPEQCRQIVASVNAEGGSAAIIRYPNAVHEFDHPNRKVTKRTGLAFTGDNSGEALVGTESAARDDALIRVPAFLK